MNRSAWESLDGNFFKPRDGVNNHHRCTASNEPIANVTSRTFGRFPRIPGLNVLILIAGAAAMVGLSRLDFHMAPEPAKRERAAARATFKLARSEVLDVWLSPALKVLSKRQDESPFIRTHEELQRILALDYQQDVWYALFVRAYQTDGQFSDVTLVRHPYTDAVWFPEFLDVLATEAGKPPHYTTSDFSQASVRLVPEELAKRPALEVMKELLSVPHESARE
jgi:hypothetical protein